MREGSNIADFIFTCLMVGGAVYILAILATKWFSGSVLG